MLQWMFPEASGCVAAHVGAERAGNPRVVLCSTLTRAKEKSSFQKEKEIQMPWTCVAFRVCVCVCMRVYNFIGLTLPTDVV